MDLKPQLQTDSFSNSRTAVNLWAWKVQDRKEGVESALWYRWNPQSQIQPFLEDASSTTAFLYLLVTGSPHFRWCIQQGGSSCHCAGLPGSPHGDQEEIYQMTVKADLTCFVWMVISPFLVMIWVVQRTSPSSLTTAFANMPCVALQPEQDFSLTIWSIPSVCSPTVQGWLSHCSCFSTNHTVIDLIIY